MERVHIANNVVEGAIRISEMGDNAVPAAQIASVCQDEGTGQRDLP